jgi:branched-chain amino acid transport system permease protein
MYAPAALAFVVVYKASRMMNFALGEWLMLGSRLVATGIHALGVGLVAAVGGSVAVMVGTALVFSRIVLHRMVGHPAIALIMVTIGLGAVMRGSAAIVFAGIPGAITLPIATDPIIIRGVPIAADKLLAAAVSAVAIVAVSVFFRVSRTGVALRAIADNQPAAMTAGIDVQKHFALTWAMMAILSVLAGTLWTVVSGGGFGVVLLGLKIFPIVFIGGLDSLAGTLVGAIVIGVLESVAAGYLDPIVGGGFSNVASYLVLLAALFVRPYGLFGGPDVERV